MIIWTFAHFLSFVLYCQLTVFVLYKNPRSSLNRACAGILLSFGLWSFGAIPRHGDYFSAETVALMTNISAPGWLGFSAFGLVFIMIFTERHSLLKKKWLLPAVFSPPVLFVGLQWRSGAFVESYVKQPYGWDAVWSTSPWVQIFSLYYSCLMLLILVMLYGTVRKPPGRTRATQARIIAYTCLFPFVASSLTNVILPQLFDDYRFAAMGDLFTLTFAFGIVYAALKYSFMITPAMAAEKILATMDESLFLVKPDGVITTVNKAASELLGYREEELVGRPLNILGGGGDLFQRVGGVVGIGGESVSLLHKSERPIPVLFSSAPLVDSQGEVAGIVCIARDITELRRAEEDRQNLVKMRERDEVCRWLHDHLGADLYNISLLSDLSKGRLEVDPTLTRQLEWIAETSRDALNSIRNYLDFANNSNLTLSDLTLRMEEYGRLLFQSDGIRFACSWEVGENNRPLSPLKSLSIYFIFKESITNILKHARAERVTASLENGKESFVLRIEDDGVGYVPGRTVTAGSHGITNISNWAEKAGGTLAVDPAPGGGTVVSLRVPH